MLRDIYVYVTFAVGFFFNGLIKCESITLDFPSVLYSKAKKGSDF